jgi:site-specific recombinase XerD
MVSDFQKHGKLFRRTGVHRKEFSDAYKKVFEGSWECYKKSGGAEASIQKYRQFLFRFERFLLERSVERFNQLEIHHVNAYFETLAGLCSNTIRTASDNLKRLFAHAHAGGFHHTDYSDALPAPSYRMRRRLPETFTSDEIERILENIDRNNELGKRNYAITILIARLGLRLSDALHLTFDSLDWQSKSISITQQKTGKPLELPMPEDVGWAIIDYLKHGRPESICECIFIRHSEPYGMMQCDFTKIISDAIKKSGVKTTPGRYIGMHNLRHSIASTMFNQGVELPELAQILGHSHHRSTELYINLSVEKLRECALEVIL